ncbi:unnamed protein product, partial [Ectocarpus fasciculatus]
VLSCFDGAPCCHDICIHPKSPSTARVLPFFRKAPNKQGNAVFIPATVVCQAVNLRPPLIPLSCFDVFSRPGTQNLFREPPSPACILNPPPLFPAGPAVATLRFLSAVPPHRSTSVCGIRLFL